jgi:hypothetical protein
MGDRLADLRANAGRLTGIGHVHVVPGSGQRTLHVFFLTDPRDLDTPFDPAVAAVEPAVELMAADIVVTPTASELPPVSVDPTVPPSWGVDAATGRPYLEVQVRVPGGFGRYRLSIVDPITAGGDPPRIDPFFAGVTFDFKVDCGDRLDCLDDDLPSCAPEDDEEVVLDYLARDFPSLRQALVTAIRSRHPAWTLRSEADPSAVVLDLLAALGDEFAYLQDRYVSESNLRTATQRRSLRHLARLVDYEIHDGRSATTQLLLQVRPGAGLVAVPAGAQVSDGPARPDGLRGRAVFEVGHSLEDRSPDGGGPARQFAVHDRWNAGVLLPFHFEDDDAARLACGTTSLHVTGPVPGIETWPLDGRQLLLEQPGPPGSPPQRQIVAVTQVRGADTTGATPFVDPLTGVPYHEIRWASSDALRVTFDLRRTSLSTNLVPAVAGETAHLVVRCGGGPVGGAGPDWVVPSVERQGALPPAGPPDDPAEAAAPRPVIHRVSLPGSDVRPLGWVGDALHATRPEVRVWEVPAGVAVPADPALAHTTPVAPDAWEYRPTLLQSEPGEQHVTIEDGVWAPAATFHGPHGPHTLVDLVGGGGATIRWGDGTFARQPTPGQRFLISYRLTSGADANVAADTLRNPGPGLPAAIEAVSNPLPVDDGVAPEDLRSIRDNAPVAWRDDPLFAVRTRDYAHQAERLDWVDRASAELRWTGSWPTVRVATDPIGTLAWNDRQAGELQRLLTCAKQAGRDVVTMEPRFVALDLVLRLCLYPGVDPSRVVRRVRAALVGPLERGQPLFAPAHFTFGTPLDRSQVDAAVLAVPGVYAVLEVQLGARGMRRLAPWDERRFSPGADGLLRLDADRARPEHGSLVIEWEGGA